MEFKLNELDMEEIRIRYEIEGWNSNLRNWT